MVFGWGPRALPEHADARCADHSRFTRVVREFRGKLRGHSGSDAQATMALRFPEIPLETSRLLAYSPLVIHVVPLRYGTPFKKAFSDPEVFSGFARDIVGVELEFTRIEQEKEFLAPVGAVDIRFDLFGEDLEHRVIVELQHVRQQYMFSRFHYYHLVAQIEQIKSGKNYNAERTVYTIVVLTRLPEDEQLRFDVALQSSDIVTLDGRRLGLFQHRIIFVNPRAISTTTPRAIRRWLELFEDSLDEIIDESAFPEPLFQKVIHAIEVDNLSPRENYLYKEEAEWEDTKTQSRKEGRDEGLKEGIDKGLKEGIDKGRKEGLRQGILDSCDLLGILLDETQKAHLGDLNVEALDALREQIKRTKRWPA